MVSRDKSLAGEDFDRALRVVGDLERSTCAMLCGIKTSSLSIFTPVCLPSNLNAMGIVSASGIAVVARERKPASRLMCGGCSEEVVIMDEGAIRRCGVRARSKT